MPPVRLSRRRLLTLLALGTGSAVMAACADAIGRLSPSPRASAAPTRSPGEPPARPATPSPAPEPSLSEKIGAMLLVGFRGLRLEDASSPAPDVDRLGLGGVVLFDRDQPTGSPIRNVESPTQLQALAAELQLARQARDAAHPLIVSIDQEGGLVARLGPSHGFPPTMSAAELGALGDPAVTEARATEMAETLAAAGVILNLAPVVDLNVNPTNPIIGSLGRSFGADPATVSEQALAFIRGHHAAGVLTALKHFPGHGSSTGDTHLGVVDVTETWSERELEPFASIIAAEMADAILTAHVFNARLDPTYPATLSRATITDLLRGQLGYDGVVISDDLQMGAIREAFGFDEAVKLAIEAGVDVLTIANQQVYEEGIAARVVELVVGLVEAGELDEARIDESWRRIRSLRQRLIPA